MIEVELNQMFADMTGIKHILLDVGESVSPQALALRFGFSYDDVGILLINGQWAPLEGSLIRDGDYVQFYPFIDGG